MWDSQVHGKEARTGPGQSHLERQPAAIEAGPQPGSLVPRCPAAKGEPCRVVIEKVGIC